jgi:hypothetical protein
LTNGKYWGTLPSIDDGRREWRTISMAGEDRNGKSDTKTSI